MNKQLCLPQPLLEFNLSFMKETHLISYGFVPNPATNPCCALLIAFSQHSTSSGIISASSVLRTGLVTQIGLRLLIEGFSVVFLISSTSLPVLKTSGISPLWTNVVKSLASSLRPFILRLLKTSSGIRSLLSAFPFESRPMAFFIS
jgi:hypothetical protein